MTNQTKQRIFREQLNPDFGYFYTIGKTLYSGRTKFQKIELVETPEFGKVLLLDGITQVVEKNDYQYHEPMVHPAMCAHTCPKDVLVIGGGDGGIAREVLKYSTVRRVDIAELDEEVVSFSRQYLTSINGGAFEDSRVKVHITDGRKFVEDSVGHYDVIIMDMTDPFGPSRFLYTREFFRIVKKALRGPQGLFVMHSESPVSRPATFNCIVKTLQSVFSTVQPIYQYIQMYAVLWSMSIASESAAVATLSPKKIDARLARQNISGLKMFNGSTFDAMRIPYPYISDILQKACRVLTDKNPNVPDSIKNHD